MIAETANLVAAVATIVSIITGAGSAIAGFVAYRANHKIELRDATILDLQIQVAVLKDRSERNYNETK